MSSSSCIGNRSLNTLHELLLAPRRREAIVVDCVKRLEAHVARRPGLKGLSLRAGLGAIKAIRADALPRALDRLLPDYVAALEPLYQEFRAGGGRDFSGFLDDHAAAASAAMLAVTDRRAQASRHAGLKSVYNRLRGLIETELESFLPALGSAVSSHRVE